jgi:hypothetical protein
MVEINQLICDLKLANGGGQKVQKISPSLMMKEKLKI